MLQLPPLIEVEVRGPNQEPLRDILVTVHISCEGRYYFGTQVGLTDRNGVARTTADRIKAEFELNRRTFLMDYKVSLDACDSVVTIGVPGGDEFSERRQTALTSSLIAPSAKQNWR